jgi:hypothetical protein
VEPILWIIFAPFFGLTQAAAGILWPDDRRMVRRLQWITLVVAALGIAALVCAYFAKQSRTSISLVGAGWLLLVISGLLGGYIEKQCKVNKKTRD